MMRHWYLKLWSVGANNLLLYVYDIDKLKGKKKMSARKARVIELQEAILSTSQNMFSSVEQHNMEFVYMNTGMHFRIVCHPALIVETQSCRLLKYLCTFDSRAMPLFTLVHYWARTNCVWFGVQLYTGSRLCSPEPSALEWLVATFLGSKRIIPTPREIIDRPHTPMWFADHDIGFSEDEAFTSQWKAVCPPCQNPNEFVLTILELVREFFMFLLGLGCKDFVVNTKDGELVPKTFFYEVAKGDKVDTGLNTKLTSEELSLLCKDYKDGAPLPRLKDSVVILHPLYWAAKFSLARKHFFINITRFLKHTVEKIDSVLDCRCVDETAVDLKSLLYVDLKMKRIPNQITSNSVQCRNEKSIGGKERIAMHRFA